MTIDNGLVRAEIDRHGAELCSLRKSGGTEELIWNADSRYWGRHAPMLFPIVGKVAGGHFRVDGTEYPMSQHGIARDMDFTQLEQSGDSVSFVLESSPDTLRSYPYPFRIEARYSLQDTSLLVDWTILNTGSTPMHFQIGAHPGFNFRDFCKDDFIHGYFRLTCGREPVQNLIVGQLTPGGLRSESAALLALDSDAMLPITPGLFASDAIVLEEHQIDQVVLYDKECVPYIAVHTDQTPVWGLWSPPAKNAPFVCIEPWMGRCDCDGYDGDITGRDYMNSLEPGSSFTFSYRITVL